MSQTRLESLVEACTNTIIGFGINYVANLTLFPIFGWEITLGQNFILGLCYTVISVARGYVLRRIFDKYLKKFNKWVVALWNKLFGKKEEIPESPSEGHKVSVRVFTSPIITPVTLASRGPMGEVKDVQ